MNKCFSEDICKLRLRRDVHEGYPVNLIFVADKMTDTMGFFLIFQEISEEPENRVTSKWLTSQGVTGAVSITISC